jgi:hypothetical protein
MSIPPYEEIENGIHFRYWNCPNNFIPKSLGDFMKIYRYYKDFPGAQMPSIENCSYRFFFAYQYYEKKFNEFKLKLVENK